MHLQSCIRMNKRYTNLRTTVFSRSDFGLTLGTIHLLAFITSKLKRRGDNKSDRGWCRKGAGSNSQCLAFLHPFKRGTSGESKLQNSSIPRESPFLLSMAGSWEIVENFI